MFDEFELSQEDRDEARRRALMMAGFGLLGTRKGQEGQGFSRAGLLAMDGYDNSLLGAKRGKMEQFRLRQIQAQMQEEERKRAEAEAAKQAQAAEQARITAAGQNPYADFASTGQVPKWGPEQALTAQMMAAQGVGDKEKLGKLAAQFAPEFGMTLTAADGPNGPAFLQPSKRGGVQAVQGYAPPAKEPDKPYGKVNPGDFTPASMAAFAKTGDYSVLVPIDKTPRTTVNIDNAPKLPGGYRWKDGMVGQSVEPIPGGPQDTTPQDTAKADTSAGRAEVVLGNIAAAKKLVGVTSAGAGGALLGKIPGTPAVDLQKRLDTIKANIGFQELQTMRDESKTGGALGQVAIQELNMLQATLGSLDREQSPGQLLKNLDDIELRFKNVNMLMAKIRQQKSARGQTDQSQVLRFDAQGNPVP